MLQLVELGSERLQRMCVHPNGEDTEMVEVQQALREQNLAPEEAGSGGMVGECLNRIEPRSRHLWQEPSAKDNDNTYYRPCFEEHSTFFFSRPFSFVQSVATNGMAMCWFLLPPCQQCRRQQLQCSRRAMYNELWTGSISEPEY